MNIWISVPTIIIPDPTIASGEDKADPFYEQIYTAYSEPLADRDEDKSVTVPRLQSLENEEFVAQCISSLLRSESISWIPSFIMDCRSSAPIGGPAPTYRIILKTGLTTTLPILLQGQAGSEVLQAIVFIAQMSEALEKGIVISALQRVIYPDNRSESEKFFLADGVAVIGVASNPLAFGKSFHVLGAAIVQRENESDKSLKLTVEQLLERCGITELNGLWAIAPSLEEKLRNDLYKILPNVRWINRVIYPSLNFGCADPLINLQNIFIDSQQPPSGVGLLWFAGRFGSLGILALDSTNVSMWHAHTHRIPEYVKKLI